MEDRYIASVDLGTSKIALTIAKISGEDVQVVYYKETTSEGMRNSYVLNPGKVEKCLKMAIDDAQDELGIKILQAVVGLPRYFVRQETASARTDRTEEDSQISESEVNAIKSMALESYPLSDSKKEVIYGAVAQSFSTEENINELESDVIGMTGAHLEGNFKVFIGNRRYSINIDNVFNNLGIAIAKKYFIPGITARAVLKKDQMDNGVALIDIGAGVSSVTIFKGNIMRFYAAIPFGGNSVTNDIKSECNISFDLAENIKKAYGACMPSKLSTLGDKVIQILDENDEAAIEVPVKYISEVITARMKEIIEALLYEIQESGFSSEEKLKAGVVVTGGGANLVNCANLIKEMSGYSVKIGPPRPYFSYEGCPEVLDTSASASIGMILAAKNDYMLNCIKEPPEPNWWEKVLAQDKTEKTALSQAEVPAEAHETTEAVAAPQVVEPTIEETVVSGQEYAVEEDTTVFSKPSKEERDAYEEKKKLERAREVAQRKEKKMHFQWFKKLTQKVGDVAGSIYDDINEEEV